MSISNYIKKVRAKSEEEKQRIAFLWTVVLIIVVFFVWAITFSLSVAERADEEARLRAQALEQAKAESAQKQNLIIDQNGNQVVSLESSSSSSPNGVIPKTFKIMGDSVDSVARGFWIVGDMIHR